MELGTWNLYSMSGSTKTCDPKQDSYNYREQQLVHKKVLTEIYGNDLESIITDYCVDGLCPFYKHQWIDARDEYGIWHEAQIISLNEKNTTNNGEWAKIHYKGWKDKYDDILDLSLSSPHWKRVAPLGAFTLPPSELITDRALVTPAQLCSMLELENEKILDGGGLEIFCLDSTDVFIKAKIKTIIKAPNHAIYLCEVTYDGWNPKYNEWIPTTSYRIVLKNESKHIAEYYGNKTKRDILHLLTVANDPPLAYAALFDSHGNLVEATKYMYSNMIRDDS